MMSLWDALRMNMMISYQELVRTFPNTENKSSLMHHAQIFSPIYVRFSLIADLCTCPFRAVGGRCSIFHFRLASV